MKLGIDLGGTKIEGVILSDSGVVLDRKRVATPAKSYSQIIKSIANLIGTLCQSDPTLLDLPVGIGIPGSLSNVSGLVKNANTTTLIGKALDKDLQANLCLV